MSDAFHCCATINITCYKFSRRAQFSDVVDIAEGAVKEEVAEEQMRASVLSLALRGIGEGVFVMRCCQKLRAA